MAPKAYKNRRVVLDNYLIFPNFAGLLLLAFQRFSGFNILCTTS